MSLFEKCPVCGGKLEKKLKNCSVELNDSSHQSNNRQKRDGCLKGACGAAGIPLTVNQGSNL